MEKTLDTYDGCDYYICPADLHTSDYEEIIQNLQHKGPWKRLKLSNGQRGVNPSLASNLVDWLIKHPEYLPAEIMMPWHEGVDGASLRVKLAEFYDFSKTDNDKIGIKKGSKE